MLPTTRHREQLLRECLAWVADNYDGGPVTEACHVAVREVLHLPADDRPLSREMFLGEDFRRALVPYGEVLGLDAADCTDADHRLAETIRRDLVASISQPDLTEEQRGQAHVESMMAGLEYWLTWTPGGLADAVSDLFVLIYDGCSFV